MRLTLKQLQYFDALARAQHFGRAAELCAVSQPALSVQIKDLEGSLGVELIERARSGIRLTQHGTEVAARARRILSEVTDLEASVQAERGRGVLRLGVIPTVAPYLLPGLLRHMQTAQPGVDIRVRESQTARLVEALQRGALDVLLVALPVNGERLISLPLFDDAFQLLVPASMPVRGPVAIGELPKFRLLLLEEGHCLRDQALAICHGTAKESLATLGASSLATLVELVAAGQGVTLVPQMCEPSIRGDRRVRLIRLNKPAPSRSIGLVWRRSSAREDIYRALGRCAKSAVKTTA